ncbi:MAG: hypothetical protein AAFZ74_01940 [Pseudomonadota bacterium]
MRKLNTFIINNDWLGFDLDDGVEIRAYSAWSAVKNYAEVADADGDYDIVRGAELVCAVRTGYDQTFEEAEWFNVSGETSAVYYASELEGDDKSELLDSLKLRTQSHD